MRVLKSCGVLVFRRDPELSFLLLRHPDRYDLPKGHLREGESEQSCALRELLEETGLPAEAIHQEDTFRFATTYYPHYRRFGGEVVEKTTVIFLAWLGEDRPIVVSEHGAYEWVPWQPPHRIEAKTVDALLAEVERFFTAREGLNG
jgi:8-oxo-dGTP pyrophosphatase MutT (NUDIX family)